MINAVQDASASDRTTQAFPTLLLDDGVRAGAGARRARLVRDLPDDVALQLHRHEHDLAARALRHRLQRLELPDLHRGGAREDVRGLAHEARRVDLRAGGDDLGLPDALLLRGGRERRGHLGGEDDVLDEDALDGDAPLVRDVADDLGDLERDRLALGHDGLHHARADDVTEGGLRTLDERLAEVRDAEGGAVGVRDLEIDDRVAVGGKQSIRAAVWMRRECAHFNVDIVTGDNLLPADRTNLDLHVDNAQRLGANVHLNETGVD